MLKLNSRITITGVKTWVFTFLNEVTIERSWRNLTQKGSIIIPNKILWDGQSLISSSNPIIKRGDRIKIELGYSPNLNTYFEGYITNIIPGKPVTIEFEDSMWLLKQTSISKYSGKNLTLLRLLTDLGVPDILPVVCVDVNLGKFSVTRSNVAQVLDYLNSEYGLVSFVRNGTLYSGLAYWIDDNSFGQSTSVLNPIDRPRTFKRVFQQNIIDSNLTYSRLDDQKIKVEAISINPDNTRISVTVGDPDGDIRTLHQYGLTESELTAYANNYLDQFKFEGFEGTFTTFGDQFCDHGDTVELINNELPDQNGSYLISKVVTTFGINGFRNEIELDGKAE